MTLSTFLAVAGILVTYLYPQITSRRLQVLEILRTVCAWHCAYMPTDLCQNLDIAFFFSIIIRVKHLRKGSSKNCPLSTRRDHQKLDHTHVGGGGGGGRL